MAFHPEEQELSVLSGWDGKGREGAFSDPRSVSPSGSTLPSRASQSLETGFFFFCFSNLEKLLDKCDPPLCV